MWKAVSTLIWNICMLELHGKLQKFEKWHDVVGSRSNRPQTKAAPSQIGPRSNHCIIMLSLFNLMIYTRIVNCVV